MTSIKPPTKAATTPPTDDLSGAGAARGPSAPRETFREALDAARPSTPAAAPESIGRITDDLRAGRIDASTAVERLVARALSAPDAAGLSPARKAELEAHLRDALAEDPTLVALTKDLERAR